MIKYLAGEARAYDVHAADIRPDPALQGLCVFHQVEATDEAALAQILKTVEPDFIVTWSVRSTHLRGRAILSSTSL